MVIGAAGGTKIPTGIASVSAAPKTHTHIRARHTLFSTLFLVWPHAGDPELPVLQLRPEESFGREQDPQPAGPQHHTGRTGLRPGGSQTCIPAVFTSGRGWGQTSQGHGLYF